MTATAASPEAPAITATRFPRPSLGRLVLVELRKMTDTRAGFWLLISTLLLATAAIGLMLAFEEPAQLTLDELFATAFGVASLLLPVIGILAVTSEWSQRTALSTFTLVPRRERVILAKGLAVTLFAIGATVACLQLAVLGNALAPVFGDADGSWSLASSRVGTAVLYQALGLLGGFAIGLALMSSAPAIVLAYVLPIAFAVLAETIPGFRDTADWLDTSVPMAALAENEMDGEAWAQLASSWAIWLGLPLAIGLWRLHRRELA